MAVLEVLSYPDERLTQVAPAVDCFDEQLKADLDNMLETLYATKNGVGLAATQVGILKRLVVIDLSMNRDNPFYLVNPEITAFSEEQTHQPEGCLSVPMDVRQSIARAEKISVTSVKLDGECFSFEAEGFLARCIQHEVDHLDGKLFIDHLDEAVLAEYR